MSAQSILTESIENHQYEFDRKLLDAGDKFTMHKRFMVGTGINIDRMMHIKSFHKLLCTDNCELIDFINKKIKGEIKDCDMKGKLKISDLYKKYEEVNGGCSITEACSGCNWEVIEW